MASERTIGRVLEVKVDAIGQSDAIEKVLAWAERKQSRYVVLSNVHLIVTASRDPAYGASIAAADLALPDGAPVAWMLARIGFRGQRRVSGPDLMWALCECCARKNLSVYFYGSTERTLEALRVRLHESLPDLDIARLESPPFRELSADEDARAVERMNASKACIVFVGLGCPKQEVWMSAHRGRVHAVMIGVGAAFDFHAGTIERAPLWMRTHGLEWLHRLCREPSRLWKRYLVTNTLFVLGAARQLLSARRVR